MKISLLDGNGLVVEQPPEFFANQWTTVEEQIANINSEGLVVADGWADKVLPDMPDSPILSTLSSSLAFNLPNHSVVVVGDLVWEMDDSGQISIDMQSTGTYEIMITPPFPVLRWAGRVVVS